MPGLECKVEAERKGLNFTLVKPKEPFPKAFIDKNQAEGVFKIILDNAVRYTQKGEIKVWTERKENFLLIAIKDSGAGIEKEALPLIFEGLAKGKAGVSLSYGRARLKFEYCQEIGFAEWRENLGRI